ncbi:MAG: SDR family NAD(P)-dependent oxidoreductase, partial [bacterium]
DGLDALVLSHGVFTYGLDRASDEDRLQAAADTNFTSRALIFTELVPDLASRRGQVFEVNSTAARGIRPDVPWYSASLAGSLSFFRSVAGAEGVKGKIRVCSIILGRTATPMQEDVVRLEGRPYRPDTLLSPDAVGAFIAFRLAGAEAAPAFDAAEGHLAEVVLLPPPVDPGGEDGGGP